MGFSGVGDETAAWGRNRMLIDLALYLFGAQLWLMFGYQALLAVWGWRLHAGPPPSESFRIAVLIPAHNEEVALGRVLASLRAADYPREQLFVLVVADHCTDGTARVAQEAGVFCLERVSGKGGKAAALSDGLAQLQAQRPGWADAVAFFDADNVVDPAFFRYATGRLLSGTPVVQGYVGIANWDASLFTRLNYINATVENRFKELARSQAGFTCQLRGHGMVFRHDLFKNFDWRGDSLVEDKGMVVRLMLSGTRVVWEERARVESVLPANVKNAAAQRRRWAGGKSAVGKAAVRALMRKWIADRDFGAFDLMVDFLMPSHAVQLSLVFAATVSAAVFAGLHSWVFGVILSLLPAYLAYFYLGSQRGGVPAHVFLNFFAAPFYIVWRTWIHLTRHSGTRRWC